MQREIVNQIWNELRDALLDSIWIQWKSLGTFVDTDGLSKSLVDPDSLLLISLELRHHEGRLRDMLASWAINGSTLFSVQRIKNLLGNHSFRTGDRLSEFAFQALSDGKDHRWKSLAGSDGGPGVRHRDLWKAYPAIWHPSALFLRLRLGFGIGIAPDLIAYLLSLNGEWSNTRLISQAIDYSPYSVRRVADRMAAAGLLESTQQKPVRYRLDASSWCQLLGIDREVPSWHYWNKVFAFSSAFLSKVEDEWVDRSPYILSTELRDLVEAHKDTFRLNKIDYPDPNGFEGEDYLEAFLKFIPKLAAWIRENV
jgi:hypothetical protein